MSDDAGDAPNVSKRKKTGTKSTAAKSGKSPSSRKKAGKKPARSSWRRWLLLEALTLLAGAGVGAGFVGYLLWQRATADVETYLHAPPPSAVGTIFSGPIRIARGETVRPEDLFEVLLLSGYERVDKLVEPNQFSMSAESAATRFEIHTAARKGPGFEIPASEFVIRIDANDRVTEGPRSGALLAPTTLAIVGDTDRQRADIGLDEVSPWVEKAVTAMEDQHFRHHSGVDFRGVARAAVHNLRQQEDLHGGSTLTQQLAKNLFLTSERTFQRKVREAYFALALERTLSKDEILELYFREVYLGQSAGRSLHGIEAAARDWFGVSAKTLDLDQAATIAGVISAPNAYSPLRHPERAVERRNLALARMEALGLVDAAEADRIRQRPLRLSGIAAASRREAPWAVDLAVEYAESALGEGVLASAGYAVYTTIDPLLQRAAEHAVTDGIAEVERDYPKARGTEAALVTLRATDGTIAAMVGGRNYAQSPFNRATDAWRQVGSTVKPLTALAAFDADPTLTPLTPFRDEPISRTVDGKPWSPQNYDQTFHGEVTLRHAIEASLNVPAVLLAERVGPGKLQASLRKVGLSRSTNLPSTALGGFAATPVELAQAYTVFPSGGAARRARLVYGIVDSNGQTVLLADVDPPVSVASARATALAASLLRGVMTDGTAARVREFGLAGNLGGKTGTTDNYRDAWLAGFHGDFVTVAWVGRDVGEPVGLSGSRAALPAWARFASAAGPLGPVPAPPQGIVAQEICVESHLSARPDCPKHYAEWFPAEAARPRACDLHGGPLVKVRNLVDGLLQTEVQPTTP